MRAVRFRAAAHDGQMCVDAAREKRIQRGDRDVAALSDPVEADEEKVQPVEAGFSGAGLGQMVEIHAEGRACRIKIGEHEILGGPVCDLMRGIDHARRTGRDAGFHGIGFVGNLPAIGLAQEGGRGVGDMERRQMGLFGHQLIEKRAGHEAQHRVEPMGIHLRHFDLGFLTPQEAVKGTGRPVRPQDTQADARTAFKRPSSEITRPREGPPVVGIVR